MEVTLWVSCYPAIADNFYLRFWARVPTSNNLGEAELALSAGAPYPLSWMQIQR